MFYLKMAWNNLKTSAKAYAPFVLASFILFSLTCSTLLIMTSPMAKDMGDALIILPLGVVVLSLLSLIMELYSYNVLLKQRSREFGLYNILGMNKRQVGWVATLELTMIFIITVVFGSLFSAVLSNAMYLIFVNVVKYDQLILTLSPLAFAINTVLFAGIFLVLEIVGLRRIGKTSPLMLFRSQEQGEKEPKGNIFLAFLALVFIGSGYAISVLSRNLGAIAVVLYFFVAVILVILGTYLFYISFMTWYLKRRRQNKGYFYQPKNFITTSQMIFRMKQNATGLASITLLAVMAFVSIGTTTALYVNTQQQVDRLYVKNTKITVPSSTTNSYDTPTYTYLREQLGDDKAILSYTTSLISLPLEDVDHLTVTEENVTTPSLNAGFVFVMTQDEFRKLGNEVPELAEGQALFANQLGTSHYKDMTILGNRFEIVQNLKNPIFPDLSAIYNGAILVVSDQETLTTIKTAYTELMTLMVTFTPNTTTYFVDLTDEEAQKLQLEHGGELVNASGESLGAVSRRQGFLEEGYNLFGGMLFTGVLLGISFLLGAALIIYYKQYSEGQEDKKSYRILQEVGMSKQDVKKTISSQTVLVFFMPLAIAVLHYMVAMPMLRQMLMLFGVSDTNLVYLVSAVTILVISVIYYIIYRLTSRTYYKLVER